MMTRVRIIQRCKRVRFAPTPALWVGSLFFDLPVRAMVVRKCSNCFVGECGCSLQFAKASAATLSQQEKNDTADV
jgi:hypothetical protein